jgi:hypothetical protein
MALIAALPVAAGALELCIAMDGSGSVSSSDFNLQKEGLAQAVEDPAVIPPNGSVILSVVQFSGSGRVEVPPTVIDASTVSSVAGAIRSIAQIGGGTDIADSILVCASSGLQYLTGERQVIDVSTDGGSNAAAASAAADSAVSSGVDSINGMAIGSGADIATIEGFVRPQPASDPVAGAQGFVIVIDNFDEFAEAIALKISIELGGTGVPAPALGGLALLATFGALTFAGARRLRRRRTN